MKRTNKANGIRSAVPRLTDYMRSSMGVIILALILAALSAVMTILGPNQIGRIATLMSDGLTGNIDLAAIAKVGISLAVIYVLSAVFSFIQHYTMSVVTLKMSYCMRGELSAKINRVPQKYFGTTSQGDILSRITNDVSTLQQGLTNSLPTIISAATQFVGCLLMMFVTEWRLALVSIGVTILGMLLTVLILSRSQRYFAARQKSLGALNGYVEEMYSGHEVVRLSRAGRKIGAQFDTLNAAVYDANWRSQFLSGMMQPLMNIVGNIAYVAVCVLGSILAMNSTIEFGVIVSFILYVRLFTSPLTQMAQGMTNMQTASASAHRIFDFLESEEMPDENEKTAKLTDVRGRVCFDHVRFSYPSDPDKIIIRDFSAEVLPGQKVAIVGPTGAGKTTMVNLLMRFFEINSGSITIDGVPISDMRREDVHGLFSMVLQDTWLFCGTIFENIVYGRENATMEEVRAAAKSARIDSYIERLPDGTLFRLTPGQLRSVRGLTKRCCNFLDGDCLLLDGVCPQFISRSLICRWFRRAVLPRQPKLEQAILSPKKLRRCEVCGTGILARSGRTKYCPACAKEVHRWQKAKSARKRRSGVDDSGAKSP